MTDWRGSQDQVQEQSRILFCSPRFTQQETVILFAGSGEFCTLAVMTRDFAISHGTPDELDIEHLEELKKHNISDPYGDDDSPFAFTQLQPAGELRERRGVFDTEAIQKQRDRDQEHSKKQAEERAFRWAQREQRQATLEGLSAKLNEIIVKAGNPLDIPDVPPFPDALVDEFWGVFRQLKGKVPTLFFQPSPPDSLSVASLGEHHHHTRPELNWTTPIHIGTLTSNKYVGVIRSYLQGLAQGERV
jgi:hypothetical protein